MLQTNIYFTMFVNFIIPTVKKTPRLARRFFMQGA